jgi:hypothetical protein
MPSVRLYCGVCGRHALPEPTHPYDSGWECGVCGAPVLCEQRAGPFVPGPPRRVVAQLTPPLTNAGTTQQDDLIRSPM